MPPAGATPSLRRRLACMLYEGLLLFGVLMLAGWLLAPLAPPRLALQVLLFVLLAAYFVGFWSHGGQTLAMKTWHIRVMRADGAALGVPRGLIRYLAAWLWFVPGLVAVRLAGLHSPASIAGVLMVGIIGYALASKLHPQRQFWHDALCGTRLVTMPAHNSGR